MGLQFHETVCGQYFFNVQLPDMIKNLEIIAAWKERLLGTEDRTYVCYHENSASLEPEAGKISNMIATNDVKGALAWLNDSLADAGKNNYRFADECGAGKLYEALATGRECEIFLRKNGDQCHKEYFKLCIHSFP